MSNMIERGISHALRRLATQYSVVSLAGLR
jgi:hypothetical protein